MKSTQRKIINATATMTMIALGMAAPIGSASAQVALDGDAYVQTFDGLDSGLPAGWSVRTDAGTNRLGVEASFNTNRTSWGKTTGQFANYASTVGNAGTNLLGEENSDFQSSCTNRCLGARQTGSFGDPGAAFVLELENTVGFADFQLSLDCNLLSVQGRSTTWTIDYAVGQGPTNFTTLGSYTDAGTFSSATRTFALGSDVNNQPDPVWIRIVALDATTGSQSRDTFGIDNVELNYSSSAAVRPIPLRIEHHKNTAVLDWQNAASFTLQAASSAAGTYTNIPGATPPYTNSMAVPQRFFRLKAK